MELDKSKAVFISQSVADRYGHFLTDYFLNLIKNRTPLWIVEVTDIKSDGRYRLTLTDEDEKTFSVKSSWVEV